MKQKQQDKIQTKDQKLFLAKCFIEQSLEHKIRKPRISFDILDESVQFKLVQTKEIAAVAKGTKMYVFARPVKSFIGMPLDAKMVSLKDIIVTENAMRCTKCKSWMQKENIKKCPCGGYLQYRKRFNLREETTTSLDAEFVEIQTAIEDARESAKTESMPRQKTYQSNGITHSMAGLCSVSIEEPKMYSRVSDHGATWLESFGVSALCDVMTLKKIDGFAIPSESQQLVREQLCKRLLVSN